MNKINKYLFPHFVILLLAYSVVTICNAIEFESHKDKALIKNVDLDSGTIELSTGFYLLYDRVKILDHQAHSVSNDMLEKGQFIQYSLLPQSKRPRYLSNKSKIIQEIQILSEIDAKKRSH